MARALTNSFAGDDARSFSLSLLGSCVRFDSADAALADELRGCFEAPDPSDCAPIGSGFDLVLHLHSSAGNRRNGRARATVITEPSGALDELNAGATHGAAAITGAVVQWAVDRATGHYTLHAATVARGGRGILFPAKSYSGKSTLSVGLARRGFTLLSDEVGAIELDTGRLVGFPRAISLRCDVLPALGLADSVGISIEAGSRFVRGPELGVERRASVFPALIVSPRFEPGTSTRLGRMRPGLAAMALMEASCCQSRLKVAGLDFVLDLAKTLPCYRLQYSNVDAAVDEIEAIFDTGEADAAR